MNAISSTEMSFVTYFMLGNWRDIITIISKVTRLRSNMVYGSKDENEMSGQGPLICLVVCVISLAVSVYEYIEVQVKNRPSDSRTAVPT